MMTREASTKIIKLMTRAAILVLGNGYITVSHIVKMHYFFKKSSLLCGVIQTNYLVHTSNNDHGRVYQYCKFRDPQGSCTKVCPYKLYNSENAY